MFIYLITNKINGKKYIGQTTRTIEKRWRDHVNSANAGFQYPIHRAIRKYKPSNFAIVKIDTANSVDELNKLESFYIDFYNTIKPNGYNLSSGGNSGPTHPETRLKISKKAKGHKRNCGRVLSQETKDKISKANSGRLIGRRRGEMPAETKLKLRKAMLGRPSANKGVPMSEEAKNKLSNAKKGKPGTPHTKEFKEKMSDLLIGNKRSAGKPKSAETKEKMSLAAKARPRKSDGTFERPENE